MPNKKTGLVTGLLMWAMLALPAFAASIDTANSAFAQVGGTTSIPVGHAEFCRAHRSECGRNARVVDATALDEARWTELLSVNQQFNVGIVPVTDDDLYNVAEYWTYPEGYGDCEDIALAKRRALIQNGWSPSTLLMAVVRQANGEGHAVLMVRTDRGDLVLDNQEGLVKVWNDTPYQFLKRQSQTDQSQWVDIIDNRAVHVAATH
jgi:predicted transglutaminase-like cysteine proteinase